MVGHLQEQVETSQRDSKVNEQWNKLILCCYVYVCYYMCKISIFSYLNINNSMPMMTKYTAMMIATPMLLSIDYSTSI